MYMPESSDAVAQAEQTAGLQRLQATRDAFHMLLARYVGVGGENARNLQACMLVCKSWDEEVRALTVDGGKHIAAAWRSHLIDDLRFIPGKLGCLHIWHEPSCTGLTYDHEQAWPSDTVISVVEAQFVDNGANIKGIFHLVRQPRPLNGSFMPWKWGFRSDYYDEGWTAEEAAAAKAAEEAGAEGVEVYPELVMMQRLQSCRDNSGGYSGPTWLHAETFPAVPSGSSMAQWHTLDSKPCQLELNHPPEDVMAQVTMHKATAQAAHYCAAKVVAWQAVPLAQVKQRSRDGLEMCCVVLVNGGGVHWRNENAGLSNVLWAEDNELGLGPSREAADRRLREENAKFRAEFGID